jgi:23S rRNA pseudouridine1911/1915/1917 synthase
MELIVSEEDIDQYKRLDQFLKDKLENYSRTFIKKIFDNSLITSETTKLTLKKLPSAGTIINIEIPEPTSIEALPEDIPLDILFEDEHLIVINKPAGMVVHPAPGNPNGTLVNALLFHCKDLSGIGGKIRPGIVHRLDKGTTGVMVAAKSEKAMENLIICFQKHDITRRYIALCFGHPKIMNGTLEATIGRHPHHRKKMAANVRNGRNAITHYKTLHRFKTASLLELTLETGRTHQIRVHLSSLSNSPVLCDQTYSNIKKQWSALPKLISEKLKTYDHPLLHAKVLDFKHPISGELLQFSAEPPDFFQTILQDLEDADS